MNRIVLIGNGFDLAHGLKTSYKDFIEWYWEQRVKSFHGNLSSISEDILCQLKFLDHGIWNVYAYNHIPPINPPKGSAIIESIINNQDAFKVKKSTFFQNITHCVETLGWVDIENEYYSLLKDYAINHIDTGVLQLNKELKYIQDLLVRYLGEIKNEGIKIKENLKKRLYEPINEKDVSVEATAILKANNDFFLSKDSLTWQIKAYSFGLTESQIMDYLNDAEEYKSTRRLNQKTPALFRLPDKIMFLDFNYTSTTHEYIIPDNPSFIHNHIHGQLEQPETVIFGYGDEMDEQFKLIQSLNKEEYLKNIKSINYLNSSNYRQVLKFIEFAPFQIYIMGHSCGNSDRTLLNTLFEHKNCISIKPFYYVKDDGSDNYIELVQNISRNFTDMKLMRDRVVNKNYCETMS